MLRYRELSSLQGPSLLKASGHSFDIETQSIWIYFVFECIWFAQMKCSQVESFHWSAHLHAWNTEITEKYGQKPTGGIPHQVLCSALSAQSWQPLSITSLNYQWTVRPLNYRAERAMGKRWNRLMWTVRRRNSFCQGFGKENFEEGKRCCKACNTQNFWDIQELWWWRHECRVATFFCTLCLISTTLQQCRRWCIHSDSVSFISLQGVRDRRLKTTSSFHS